MSRYYCSVAMLVILLALPVVGTAEVYKWTDKQGNLQFSDTPPPMSQQKFIPPKVSTPKSVPSTEKENVHTRVPPKSLKPQAQVGHASEKSGVSAPENKQNLKFLLPGLSPNEATLDSAWQVWEGNGIAATVAVLRWKDETGIEHYTDVLPSVKGVSNAMEKIEEASAKHQDLMAQAGQWDKLSADQRRELTAKTEQNKADQTAAWSAATPTQRRQHMMKALAPFVEKWKEDCRAGKGDECLTMASMKRQDGEISEARTFYELGCQHGNRKACAQHILMEAVEGSPRQARTLMGKLCPAAVTGQADGKDNCKRLRLIVDALPPPSQAGKIPYLSEALSRFVDKDLNLVHAPFPQKPLEQMPNVNQSASPSPQATAAGRAYSEAIQSLLGISRPVDLAQASKRLNEAQAGGFDVGARLFTLAQEINKMGGWPDPKDTVIIHYKAQLLLKKACEIAQVGQSQACFYAALVDQDFI